MGNIRVGYVGVKRVFLNRQFRFANGIANGASGWSTSASLAASCGRGSMQSPNRDRRKRPTLIASLVPRVAAVHPSRDRRERLNVAKSYLLNRQDDVRGVLGVVVNALFGGDELRLGRGRDRQGSPRGGLGSRAARVRGRRAGDHVTRYFLAQYVRSSNCAVTPASI